MLALLHKDFKLIFAGGKVGKFRVVSYAINVLLLALFISIGTFIISKLLSKLSSYLNAPIAFLSIALFIITLLMIFVCLVQAKKLFFNQKDTQNLIRFPIKNWQIILSKLLFLFAFQYVAGLMFTYPVIASYAVIFHRGKNLFYLGFFYPILAFPFECGVALMLVYPYKLLSDFLKKHPIVQFIAAAVIMFGLCWLYSRVLNVFVTLVASNSFDFILNANSIARMISARKFMLPITWLVDLFFGSGGMGIIVYILIALGVFLLGIALCVLSFNYLQNMRIGSRSSKQQPSFKPKPVNSALIKKEFTLLFKDSNNLVSFTGLLVVQPFLIYLIISSINTIFTSGIFAYYVAILPNFLPVIDMLLVILISLIIGQGANSYISNEANNLRLVKILPVSIFLQLSIKVLLPLVFVISSVLVSYIILLSLGAISVWTALFGFLITLIIHCIFSVISLYEELKIRHNRTRTYFLSSTFSYMLPIVYALSMILLSYFGLSIFAVYAIGLALVIASGLPWIINLKSRVLRLFSELEVVN